MACGVLVVVRRCLCEFGISDGMFIGFLTSCDSNLGVGLKLYKASPITLGFFYRGSVTNTKRFYKCKLTN